MDSLRLALDLCSEVSAHLDRIGHHTPEAGVTCLAYTNEETAAMDYVGAKAVELGARVFRDQAGNMTAVIEGENSKLRTMMGGSHLDAVPQGGQYDGRAGVLAELAVLKMLHEESRKLPFDYALQIFRAEESPRFGKALIGSAFATGRAMASDFNRQVFGDGPTLSEEMAGQGVIIPDLEAKVSQAHPLLPLRHIGAFREMHIEQANVVRGEDCDLGVVTGIRGNVRADVRYLGRAGHTGGEAQYSVEDGQVFDERAEASRGMARLIVNLEDHCEQIAAQGRDIVFSAPMIETPDASATKVCDNTYGRLEVRSTDKTVLEEVRDFINSEAQQIAQQRGLEIDQDGFQVVLSDPVPELSDKMVSHLVRSAMELQIRTTKLPSGAGHDAMNMALAGILTSMYFVPHNGLSHRPDENMVLNEGDDPFAAKSPFSNAVRALYQATTTYKMALKPGDIRPQTFISALQDRGATEVTEELVL